MTDRNALLRKLHARVRQLGLSDDAYRDRLEREFGLRSAGSLSDGQLEHAIGLFHVKQNANFPHTRLAKALWIALSNLGAVDRRDAALDQFVMRQTGKQRLAFLTPAEAGSVTEALKAMCVREGFALPAASRGGVEARHALLRAQWTKLGSLGEVRIPHVDALHRWLDKHFKLCAGGYMQLDARRLDEAANVLGRWIRSAKSAAEKISAAQ